MARNPASLRKVKLSPFAKVYAKIAIQCEALDKLIATEVQHLHCISANEIIQQGKQYRQEFA